MSDTPSERLSKHLFAAASNGDPHSVKWAVSQGASIDETNRNHDTPLHLAIESQNLQTVKLLLDFGSNPNIVNRQGRNAVELAHYHACREIGRLLDEHSS